MGVADDFAPSFTQKPQLRQEDEGNRLIFECQLVSSPKPEISWFRGETQLSEDARTNFKIQSVGTNKFLVVLELDDVIETDAGLYKVKAKNKMGEVAASINLNFSRKFISHVHLIFFRLNAHTFSPFIDLSIANKNDRPFFYFSSNLPNRRFFIQKIAHPRKTVCRWFLNYFINSVNF